MIAALSVALVGVLCLAIQGAVATVLPRPVVPDFTPLFALALALQVGGARGLVGSALIGIAADALTGAPFGHLALLAIAAYLGARAANASLELRSRAAQSALAAIWTPLSVALTLALAWSADLPVHADASLLGGIVLQAAVAALLAPWVGDLVERIVGWSLVDEMGRRGVPLAAPRRMG